MQVRLRMRGKRGVRLHFIPLLSPCLQLDESEAEGLRVSLMRWCHGNHLKKRGVGMHLNQTHHMSLMHSSMLRCRQRHRLTAHGSWPHQMAHRTADDAPHHCAPAAAGVGRRWRAAPLRACSSGGWPQMARRTIARLQQRGLAADGMAVTCLCTFLIQPLMRGRRIKCIVSASS